MSCSRGVTDHRLHLDHPTSPATNLPRISHPSSAMSTPGTSSPTKHSFSAIPPPLKADAETSNIEAMGERGAWEDVDNGYRAHRELSVIEESASPAKPLRPKKEDAEEDEEGEQSPEAVQDPSNDDGAGTSPPDSVAVAS